MLGLSSGLIKGASTLRSIVKSGLQAWYKSDRTQAPLGEELVVNGGFAIGHEILPVEDLSSFSVGVLATDIGFVGSSQSDSNSPAPAIVEVNGRKGIRLVTTGSIVQLNLNNALNVGSSYLLKYEVLEHNTGVIQAGGWDTNYDGVTEDPTLPNSVGKHEFLLKNKSSVHSHFSIKRHSSKNPLDIVITNLSLKQVNPNDSFVNNGNVTFEDGVAKLARNTGVSGGLRQNDLFSFGKTYEITYEITQTQSNSIYIEQQGQGEDLDGSVGVHKHIYTPGGSSFTYLSIQRRNPNDSSEIHFKSISAREVTNSVKDHSSNNNTATLYSGVCLDFDGSNDEICIDNRPISTGTSITAAFWIKPDTSTVNRIFLSNGRYQEHGWYIWQNGAQIKVTLNNEDGGVGSLHTTPAQDNFYTNDAWQRVVVVIPPNGQVSFYKDGELKKTETASYTWKASQSDDKLVIGNLYTGNYQYKGQLADVQIYDKLWTGSDVTFDYNNPDKDVFDNINSSILPSNCKALYRLNEGAGNRLYDAAPVLGDNLLPAISTFNINGPNTDEISIVNGNAVFNSSSVGNEYLLKGGISNINTSGILEISITVENHVSGSVRAYFGDPDTLGNGKVIATGNGTFKLIVKPDANDFYIQANNPGFEGTVTAISAKEITPASSVVQTSWVASNWVVSQPYIPQYAKSSFSKKLVFTDVDVDVDVGAQSIPDNQAFSVSFWYAQTADSTSDNYILSKHDSKDDYIKIFDQNTHVEFKVNGGTVVSFNITDLTDFKLSHIVLTRASGNNPITKCYVNGILEATDTSANADGVFEYQQIGAGGTDNAGTFFLDELAILNKELSLTEVQEIFNSGTALDVRNHSAYSNLIGYWRNNGADTWTDLSTYSNDGTVNGTPTIIKLQEVPLFNKDTLGLPMNRPNEGSLNFDGDGYASISSDPSLTSPSVSVECWIKLKENPEILLGAVSKYQTNQTKPWLLGITNSRYVKWFQNGGTHPIVADASTSDRLSLDTWRHVAVTYDGGTLETPVSTNNARQIFIDGELRASDTDSSAEDGPIIDTHNTEVEIGRYAEQASKSDNAYIDDVKIYNRVLTAAEVKKNYNATKGKHKN